MTLYDPLINKITTPAQKFKWKNMQMNDLYTKPKTEISQEFSELVNLNP